VPDDVRLSVTIPEDLARMVREEAAREDFGSDDAVIAEALRCWRERKAGDEARLDRIRAMIQEARDDPRPSLSEAEVDAFFEAKHRRMLAERGNG